MYNDIINEIESNLTGNKSDDKLYLMFQIQKYLNHEYSNEINKGIYRLLWNCYDEEEQKQYFNVSKDESPAGDVFHKVYSYLNNNELKKAFDLLDSYFKKDHINPFEDDKFKEFSNPLEEAIFYKYFGSDKEVVLIPGYFPIFNLYTIYGNLLFQFNDIPKAKIYLNKAAKINPVSTRVIFNLSEIYLIEKDFDNFYKYTIQALKFSYSPENLGKAYRDLALYYTYKDNLKLATYLYYHSLKFDYTKTAIDELKYFKSKGFNVNHYKNDDFTDEFIANKIPLGPNKFILDKLIDLMNHYKSLGYEEVYEYFENFYNNLIISNSNNGFQISQDKIYELVCSDLNFYVRDLNLSKKLINKYSVGRIVQERGAVDSSYKIGKMVTNCRFAILSNHMLNLSSFEHGTNWGLFTANSNSIFKVLDIYKYKGKVQILLLHLVNDYWQKFIGNEVINENLVNKSREIFRESFNHSTVPELATKEWLRRCDFPIGLDPHGNLWDIK
ncbi:hypothetical protein BGI41_01485 [Methanobrevibacter sp. 87.7]|uniref:tetratricopeptide repeat protein n=1 Tax=Methanobrevibacter sp. 87.7 TaxID=387957 RepID=UPI000B50244E|nr:hypothetical protein [Methanobrevibacter sp. 87.7]OWT33609.1 hypothetical protein BGI41_01485 [Methanobrevibacter sp. 87.7]